MSIATFLGKREESCMILSGPLAVNCWLPKLLKIKINFFDLSTVIFLVANKFQKQKLNDLKLH